MYNHRGTTTGRVIGTDEEVTRVGAPGSPPGRNADRPSGPDRSCGLSSRSRRKRRQGREIDPMTPTRWLEAQAPRGMVATPHLLASQSGVAALRAGGTALA